MEVDDDEAAVAADIAARDGGEAYPTLPIGPGLAPARQPRPPAATLNRRREQLGDGRRFFIGVKDSSRRVAAPSPPRVTQSAREARLKEALDDMQATQGAAPANLRAVQSSKDEAKCVSQILAGASVGTAGEEHPDTCPIDRAELFRYFTGTSSARAVFDYDAARGQKFRAALASFGPAVLEADALDGELAMDEVEDQLPRAAKASSPGHDGIGYDIYRCFAAQLRFPFFTLRSSSAGCIGGYRLRGMLALLSRWLEGNNMLPMAQKGFRPTMGAMSTISWPPRCWTRRGVIITNSTKFGATDPVRQEVGFYQRFPLSPLLFIAALVLLVSAVWSGWMESGADGIRRCHSVVVRFLAWIGLRANPAKYASLAVTQNARGNLGS
ncbi:unnamed protein product [Peronospora belbahrii]|uniref:Uncharacterized protein n=1 Tax=Peronospora belbahrii TaxID=622444 RepID=A0AAU9L6B2_9STRA|nr:unnamed protein product [Peronospora belbahrii]